MVARALSCERDDRLLFEDLDLEIAAGQIYQLEGPNGSGKTSLLRILCGLSSHYRGELFWQGQPINKVRVEFLSQLLYLGHQSGIKSVLSPRENLAWYAAIKGADGSQAAIEGALQQVGLRGFEDSPCYSLSAGQQRRVSLARLFLIPAALWMLDEPFTAIDKKGVEELEGWIAEHARRGGSVVLTTHHELNIDQSLQRIRLGAR